MSKGTIRFIKYACWFIAMVAMFWSLKGVSSNQTAPLLVATPIQMEVPPSPDVRPEHTVQPIQDQWYASCEYIEYSVTNTTNEPQLFQGYFELSNGYRIHEAAFLIMPGETGHIMGPLPPEFSGYVVGRARLGDIHRWEFDKEFTDCPN